MVSWFCLAKKQFWPITEISIVLWKNNNDLGSAGFAVIVSFINRFQFCLSLLQKVIQFQPGLRKIDTPALMPNAGNCFILVG